MTVKTLTQTPRTNPPNKIPFFVADEKGKYKSRRAITEDQILKAGKAILKKRVITGCSFSDVDTVANFFRNKLIEYQCEIFACAFLDNKTHLIKYEEMFRGTIDSSGVYPREVVKRALQLNAAAVIFAHNHPSGVTDPSFADTSITLKLKDALETVDIRTLDHFIVGFGWPYSFARHLKI